MAYVLFSSSLLHAGLVEVGVAAITSRPRHFQYHRNVDQISLHFHHYMKSVNMDKVSCPTHEEFKNSTK